MNLLITLVELITVTSTLVGLAIIVIVAVAGFDRGGW